MVKPHCSNFQKTAAIFSGVPVFHVFTIIIISYSQKQFICEDEDIMSDEYYKRLNPANFCKKETCCTTKINILQIMLENREL